MADIPDTLVLKKHRDLVGRRREIWVRRGLLTLLAAFLVVGLANVFGQRPVGTASTTAVASLHVHAPAHVRGGLMYQARVDIHARQELKQATLVLNRGWLQGLTINTIEPSPVGEASKNGDLVLTLGHVPAGDVYSLYIQYQVNPTTTGARKQAVELADGSRTILSMSRTLTVFP